MENRLRLLFSLQQVDSGLDDLEEMKGDLPHRVAELESHIQAREQARKELEDFIRQSIVQRDAVDVEIVTLREKIEKYKSQQFQVKTNKQYDALTREIDAAQETINKLQKEMETLEGKVTVAKQDIEKFGPDLKNLTKELEERRGELTLVNKEHEEEELKLRHERDKIVVRIDKSDLRRYERIRQAKNGKAVVPVRRNACGGCFKRIPPQTVLELRKNTKLILCEHCGRILVSDEIVSSVATV